MSAACRRPSSSGARRATVGSRRCYWAVARDGSAADRAAGASRAAGSRRNRRNDFAGQRLAARRRPRPVCALRATVQCERAHAPVEKSESLEVDTRPSEPYWTRASSDAQLPDNVIAACAAIDYIQNMPSRQCRLAACKEEKNRTDKNVKISTRQTE